MKRLFGRPALPFIALVILLFGLAPGCFGGSAPGENMHAVRIGLVEFEPLCGRHQEPYTAFLRATLDAIAAREQWRPVYRQVGSDEGHRLMASGELDLLGPITRDNSLAVEMNFGREVFLATWAQVLSPSGTNIQAPPDLNGMVVGLVGGTCYSRQVREALRGFDVKCRLVEFRDHAQLATALNRGWVDAAVMDRLYGALHADLNSMTRSGVIFSPIELRFAAAPQARPELLAAVDYHLRQMKQEPESVYSRHLGAILSANRSSVIFRRLIFGLGVTGCALALTTAILLLLRRQIKAKTTALRQRNEMLATEIELRRERESRIRLLATVVEQSSDGILITGRDHCIQYVNPAFERLTGFASQEVMGCFPGFLYPNESQATVLAEMTASLEAGRPWSGRVTNQRKNGGTFLNETTVYPIVDADGRLLNHVRIKRDVTVEDDLERQLRQAQKMQAIGRLAGGIAHDFNNILMAMVGYSEIALLDIAAESPARGKIQKVLDAGMRARDLIQQILTFSRAGETAFQPVDIGVTVREALSLLRASIPSTIEIRQDLDAAAGFVRGDPTQIYQVVMNLCTNAAHAMEKGGILTVAVAGLELDSRAAGRYLGLSPGRHVCLKISDTGCGMNAATLERLFEPFFTTKALGKGTGLGLSVVHGIVKRHCGAIHVQSGIGEGTTFTIFIPRSEVSCRPQAPVVSLAPTGRGHILVVDDEPMVADVCQKMIEHLGYRATVFTDSLAALAAFREDPAQFDLILTDLTMPGLTGDRLAGEMRRVRPLVPVIMISGYKEAAKENNNRETHTDINFLTKPVTAAVLARAIHHALAAPVAVADDSFQAAS